MDNPFSKASIKKRFQLNEEFNQRFDNISQRYEEVSFGGSNGTKFVNKKEKEIILDILNKYFHPSDRKVLDIGAGNGRWSKLFLSLNSQVCALDISQGMCKMLARIDKLNVIEGDIQQLKLDEKFDLVFSMRALKYTDLRRALENITYALKDEGLVVFELPYRYNPFYVLYSLLAIVLVRIRKNNRHVHYILTINLYGKSEVRKMILDYNYKILHIKKGFFFPDFFYSKVTNETLLKCIIPCDTFFSKILPRSLIYVIQKGHS